MAKKVAKLKKKTGTFTLIGKAKVGDYTFQTDQSSTNSDWIYNSLGLYVYCGQKHGDVKCELMGGYGSEREENFIYAHGKKDDGKDDFDNRMNISWDDRLNDDVLNEVGDMCFITVGLEKNNKNKTVYEKFLSPYDAIAYIQEHLSDETIVNIKGTLSVNEYNGNITYKRVINSIVLSSREEKDFKAIFKLTMLIDRDSIGELDKDTNMVTINTRVIEYFKTYNGENVADIIAIPMEFNFDVSKFKEDKVNSVLKTLFKPSKNDQIDEITMEGEFVSTGSVVEITEDDIPPEIKTLIDLGVYSKEEAITKCSETSKSYTMMVLTKPTTIMKESKDGTKTPVILRSEDIYTEEQLELSSNNNKVTDPSDVEDDVVSTENEDLAWMEGLGLD